MSYSILYHFLMLFQTQISGHIIMGQWMTHKINNNINNNIIHKSDHLAINLVTYLMTTINSRSLPHPCLVAFLIDKPRIHAFGMAPLRCACLRHALWACQGVTSQ